PEGVVLQEQVVVEQMDASDGRLAHEVEHVSARAAESDNADNLPSQPLGQPTDAVARRRGIDIAERRLSLLGGDDPAGSGADRRIDRGRMARYLVNERDHLLVIVGELAP